MCSAMASIDDILRRARAAYEARDWTSAYRDLQAARERGSLSADDLFALGDAAWWLGLIRETLTVSEECYQRFLEEGRVARAAMNALDIGFAWFMRGDPMIGSAWISRARRLLEDEPECVEQGFLMLVDAGAALDDGDLDNAQVLATQVRDVGRRFSSPTLETLALILEATVLIHRGDVDRGSTLLDEAMLPVVAGRLPPEYAGNAYCQVIAICWELADLTRAQHWTDVLERWCDQLNAAAMFVGVCRIHRVQLLSARGRWTDARREASTACAELAEMNTSVVGEAHYALGELNRLGDHHAAAEHEYRRAADHGRDPEPGRSLLHVATGDMASALAGVRRALADTSVVLRRPRLLAALVEIASAAGRLDEADAAAGELEAIASRYGTPGFGAWACHSRGLVLLRRGEPGAAIPRLSEACRRYRDLGAGFDVATVRALLGEAYLAVGDPCAEVELGEAARAFAALGAERSARRVSEVVARPPVPGGLTARERDVLVKVAERLTNKETAAALFISDKTVARHLANVYLKLGLSTRTAAAAWAIDQGLARPRSASPT
jgi:ATP/maltotriose-dependent transcriptional regulator MalT